ncbi:MAG: PIG-L family deacetylase [Phycisphaerales bacterium]|nr:PIG-L family deacetylase [Phycisphaerales bacterium]
MLTFSPTSPLKRILCIGAHSDDIEIGCGGTMLRLLDEHPGVSVLWVVMGGNDQREQEARASAERFLKNAGSSEVRVRKFRDAYLPFMGEQVKDYVESLKSFDPDLIFTHRKEDAHQDHRLMGELTWNAFRNHAILEYEIPKYDGDLGHPNLFVPLDESICRRKIELLMEGFPTQAGRQWFSADTFWAMLRIRGVECNSPARFAEAFGCRKMVI